MRMRTLAALTYFLIVVPGILSSCGDESVDEDPAVLAASFGYILAENLGVETERIRVAAWTTSDFHQTTCADDDPECSLLTSDRREALRDAVEGFELTFEEDIHEEVELPHLPNSADYTFVWLGTPTVRGDGARVEAVVSSPHFRAELMLEVERAERFWAVASADSPTR